MIVTLDYRTPKVPPAQLCDACLYDLRGNTSGRCPECGEPCDAVSRATSQIPWVARRQLGNGRAFVQTIRFVLFRPDRFAMEARKPAELDRRESRLFKRICMLACAIIF